ncbi:hypothetical protein MTO96_019383 [Rhipicephalus appendiculatus]
MMIIAFGALLLVEAALSVLTADADDTDDTSLASPMIFPGCWRYCARYQRRLAEDDDGLNLGDDLPKPPPAKFDTGQSVCVTKHRPSILDMKKKKKPPAKKPAKKPGESSKISSVAPDPPSVPAFHSAVTKQSESASLGRASSTRVDQAGNKDNASDPPAPPEKQPAEAQPQLQLTHSHPQSQLTHSHPWTSLLAPSGGASLKQSQDHVLAYGLHRFRFRHRRHDRRGRLPDAHDVAQAEQEGRRQLFRARPAPAGPVVTERLKGRPRSRRGSSGLGWSVLHQHGIRYTHRRTVDFFCAMPRLDYFNSCAF